MLLWFAVAVVAAATIALIRTPGASGPITATPVGAGTAPAVPPRGPRR